VISISRSNGDTISWSLPLVDLMSLIIDDSLYLQNIDKINTRLLFKLSDLTANMDTLLAAYSILFNYKGTVGSELFNYPNPFNVANGEITNIRYVITKDDLSKGKFVVFDAGGDIVHYNGLINVSKGTHDDLVWDGTDINGNRLSSGVYFGFLEIEDDKPLRVKIVIINR